MKGYGQFCPIAKASEILCERWVPLVLRELMYGSVRFNEIARGLPLMSRGLLAARLLRDAGVIELKEAEYHLTPAGNALRPVLEGMGDWAQRWGIAVVTDHDVDDQLLMWHLRRTLRVPETVDAARIVVRFDFYGLPRKARLARRSWWLVAEDGAVDLCFKDPGHEISATVTASLREFLEMLLGIRSFDESARDRSIQLSGSAQVVRLLKRWLPTAGGPPPARGPAPGVRTMRA